MEMSIISASILLFMVMDPFGNMPLFVSVLHTVPPQRRLRVVIRELFIALVVLMVVLFAGPFLLRALRISTDALHIAGGLILFLIAVKMVFGGSEQMFRDVPDGEPLIVPLAIPYVAGPSMAATLLILTGQAPARRGAWLLALVLAWGVGSVILLSATKLSERLGRRGLCAVERLMGLILTAIAVEMFLQGVRVLLAGSSVGSVGS